MKSPLHRSAAPTLLWRVGGVAFIASMTIPLAGCGSKQAETVPPPVQDAPGQMAPQTAPQANAKPGMSTSTKVKILVGAAAAYYIYKKYKASQEGKAADAQNVQYYVSKTTGQIYYRDPKTHQAHFVTPPREKIQQVQVPANQAQEYSRFRGYDNQQTGDTLESSGLFGVQ